jgi:ubiquinone/menaquinone biosynthesis C-methylase UbiE
VTGREHVPNDVLSRPVADLGCGPGHIAAHLHGLGLPVLGVDQSAGMLAIGRTRYPGVRLMLGSVLRLGLADGSCSAWTWSMTGYNRQTDPL